jgi:mono/diheme cytochrome c family protein
MKTRSMISGLLLLALGASMPAVAQENGQRDYLVYCSSCHGVDGRGNGPAVKVIPGFKPTDLTTLAKRNNGQFPQDEVRDVIDGRKALPGHNDFDTDMPLWGLQFQEEGESFSAESEAKVTGRINALIAYIRSIQHD